VAAVWLNGNTVGHTNKVTLRRLVLRWMTVHRNYKQLIQDIRLILNCKWRAPICGQLQFHLSKC